METCLPAGRCVLNLKLVVDSTNLNSIIEIMGLFTINTCKNVGVDPDTGDYFCKIEHLDPSGVSEERRRFEGGIMGEETKTIPVCLPLRIWGKRFGDGKIKSDCDQAIEVETTLF